MRARPTLAPSTRRRRADGERTRVASGALGGAVGFGLVAALLAIVVATSSGSAPQVTAAELDTYLAELEPITEDAAFVVMHGLRAGITDVGQSRYGDPVLVDMTTGWTTELRALRARLGALVPPPELRDAHRDLVAALDGYVDVALTLDDAVTADPAARPDAARRAARQGEAADDVWDAGARSIQAQVRGLGREPVLWLPDPDALPTGALTPTK